MMLDEAVGSGPHTPVLQHTGYDGLNIPPQTRGGSATHQAFPSAPTCGGALGRFSLGAGLQTAPRCHMTPQPARSNNSFSPVPPQAAAPHPRVPVGLDMSALDQQQQQPQTAARDDTSSPLQQDPSTPAFAGCTGDFNAFNRAPETPEKNQNFHRDDLSGFGMTGGVSPGRNGQATPRHQLAGGQTGHRAVTAGPSLLTEPHHPNRNPFSPYRGIMDTSMSYLAGPRTERRGAHASVVMYEQTVNVDAPPSSPGSLNTTVRPPSGMTPSRHPFGHRRTGSSSNTSGIGGNYRSTNTSMEDEDNFISMPVSFSNTPLPSARWNQSNGAMAPVPFGSTPLRPNLSVPATPRVGRSLDLGANGDDDDDCGLNFGAAQADYHGYDDDRGDQGFAPGKTFLENARERYGGARFALRHFIPWENDKKFVPLHLDVNGTVWLGTNIVDGLPYAIKEVPSEMFNLAPGGPNLKDEIAAMQLGHMCPNLQRYHAVYEEPRGECYIIQAEYCRHGTLPERWLLAAAEGSLPTERDVKKVLQQLTNGLHMLHRHGFAHGNAVVLNTLVDDLGNYKWTNFGAARRVLDTETGMALDWPISVTPPMYCPPADNANAASPFSADVFALTTSLLHLLWRCICQRLDSDADVNPDEPPSDLNIIQQAAESLGTVYSKDMINVFRIIIDEGPNAEVILTHLTAPATVWRTVADAHAREVRELRQRLIAKRERLQYLRSCASAGVSLNASMQTAAPMPPSSAASPMHLSRTGNRFQMPVVEPPTPAACDESIISDGGISTEAKARADAMISTVISQEMTSLTSAIEEATLMYTAAGVGHISATAQPMSEV